VLLQYTSGSTAVPKGVMITHANLLHNCEEMQCRLKLGPAICGMSWLPPFHDMGLIGCVFQPIYAGFTAHLMSPLTFLQRPIRWLQAISTLRAYVSGGPNFAYDFCARRITTDEKKNLDLSCLKILFTGAEPVHSQTLERFSDAFRDCGFQSDAFYPCYGLAEATLMVSAGRETGAPRVLSLDRTALEANRVVLKDESGARDLCTVVGCGQAGENVAIVSPESSAGCAKDLVGEIWVSGASVAKGYWNRPGETQLTFEAYRADTGMGPFLRTGDLGFKQDGELFVTGRLKDLIIIAGRNHYPNDIETTVEESHPSIRPGCCAAFTVVVDEQERLVIAVELDRRPAGSGTNPVEVTRAITRAIAEVHDVQIHAIAVLKAGGIPKTSSGKIQRRACQAAFIRGELNLMGD
jgi:acyl-CoA synthetase (AMP-forming)/AMP-acid ligase II